MEYWQNRTVYERPVDYDCRYFHTLHHYPLGEGLGDLHHPTLAGWLTGAPGTATVPLRMDAWANVFTEAAPWSAAYLPFRTHVANITIYDSFQVGDEDAWQCVPLAADAGLVSLEILNTQLWPIRLPAHGTLYASSDALCTASVGPALQLGSRVGYGLGTR